MLTSPVADLLYLLEAPNPSSPGGGLQLAFFSRKFPPTNGNQLAQEVKSFPWPTANGQIRWCVKIQLYCQKGWHVCGAVYIQSPPLCKFGQGYTLSSFPGSSDSKASACNVEDLGSIPGLGRSPGEGHGTPLQYSCLENSMDGGA